MTRRCNYCGYGPRACEGELMAGYVCSNDDCHYPLTCSAATLKEAMELWNRVNTKDVK